MKLKILSADRVKALSSFTFYVMCVSILARHCLDAASEIFDAAQRHESPAPAVQGGLTVAGDGPVGGESPTDGGA